MRSYAKSLELLERLRKMTPGGAQTLSKRAERIPEGAFPVALSHGDGPYVYDIDDNRYLHMICGLASMTLSYPQRSESSENPAALVAIAAATQLLEYGAAFSLATELEAEVAEKICSMIPCAEMVRFVKSGSEATEAAIRVARKATGRDLILTVGSGYHSWHSWFQAVKPEHPGIPDDYGKLVDCFRYNEKIEYVDSDFNWPHVAAVILEPWGRQVQGVQQPEDPRKSAGVH